MKIMFILLYLIVTPKMSMACDATCNTVLQEYIDASDTLVQNKITMNILSTRPDAEISQQTYFDHRILPLIRDLSAYKGLLLKNKTPTPACDSAFGYLADAIEDAGQVELVAEMKGLRTTTSTYESEELDKAQTEVETAKVTLIAVCGL